MPRQAKNQSAPQTKSQNRASVERDRADVRALKGIFARQSDSEPGADDPRRNTSSAPEATR